MKKILSLFLIVFLLGLLTGCINQKDNENTNSSPEKSNNISEEDTEVDLTQELFGLIHGFSEDDTVDVVSLKKLSLKGPITTKLIHPSQEQFKEIYDNLLKIECKNSERFESTSIKSRPEFAFFFDVENKGRFNVLLGKDYIVITVSKNVFYKHEINEDDFNEVKNLIDAV